ncbi:formylmethanofuran dehydrogenase subunit E region [Methanococcus maripaludis X1]|uniref:Formylmethanofuran dehydrogenase subunit E region n=1 Tax=Methanococcus maripaludis X1 TaxID=1053692 RepID=G0H4N8_METMI|nr:FmdE family protein [Methanococcus maripaludis]AEK19669.1 formylmethanofuran dehydrogenase subunit E region [Methanococcus maripaludis X1]
MHKAQEILDLVEDPNLLSQFERVVEFHGFPTAGAFIGIQMYNLSKELLKFSNDDRIYVVSETYNCLPDAFQILGNATTGNKGLRIEDHGKMAARINPWAPAGDNIKGVRIILDPKKTVNYPLLHAWYMNTAKVSHKDAVSELLKAGNDVYSYEFIGVVAPSKPKKKVELCEVCKEPFIQQNGEKKCLACSK